MSKSHPKSHRRSLSKGKHGGHAAKAPMEEWKPAAKTVKEKKPLFHFVLEFFLALWKRVRKLVSFGPRDKKKEPSLSPERPDAASSSSALATASGVTSEEQTEGPSFGTVNDKDPCHDPYATCNSTKATLDAEVLEGVFSSNGVWVGEFFCPDEVGLRKSKTEQAKANLLPAVIEDDEIKSQWPASDSEYWKKEHDHLKKNQEVFYETVVLRQAFSDYEKTPEFVVMNNEIKDEVLKLPAAKSEQIDMIIVKFSYTRMLRAMFFQRANMALKSSFCCIDWRKHNRFPNFTKESDDYKWWKQNFDPEILEKRLEILRVGAVNWDSERDVFLVLELVSDLNSRLHPQISQKDKVEMFRNAKKIFFLRSGGDSKT